METAAIELCDRLSQWWDEAVRVVAVSTWDEGLMEQALGRLADVREVPYWRWSRVSGLVRAGDALGGQLTRDPETLMDKVLSMPAGVVLAADLWTEALPARVLRAIREAAGRSAPVMLVATAPPGISVPDTLRQDVVQWAVGDALGPRMRRWRESSHLDLRQAVEWQQIDTPGLELVDAAVGWDAVGGLTHLKAWAMQRALALDSDRNLPFPRGVLLYGIPGTGKSLSAKAWASAWGIPLLRLNWAGLLGKYVGQSEAQLMAALAAAERLAPAILWVDELEKAIGRMDEADGGVSRRLVGWLLTWLQEHEAPILLLATANDMEGLPAELWRPGRFDALFFVDLPDAQAREDILRIHLNHHRIASPGQYQGIGAELVNFSGADIAALVLDARFLAAERGGSLTPALLREASHSMIPWAETLGEEVARRRAWAKGRLRPA
ncbi:MAG: AAA family ATPase [Firmicutes bacterium]|nr:AAA family ATPase [Bacillota bacterium]